MRNLMPEKKQTGDGIMKHETMIFYGIIALMSVFLISGCVQQSVDKINTETPFGNVESNVTQENGSTSIKIRVGNTSDRECLFSEDCEEGFHCTNDECVSNDIINNFQDCVNNNECTQTCTNCKKENYICMYSSESFKNRKCVECFMDLQCNSGYACKSYQCVKE